jgi:glycerol-3-phosphate cytidylyltransferase
MVGGEMMITVITYGTFDLFHIGHLRLLQRAKALGDRLIVAVSTDEFNEKKGKKALIPYEQRAEIVANIKCVDFVMPEESWEQKVDDIKKYNVDIFVMGEDWKGKFDYLNEFCKVVYIPRTEGISSTELRNMLQSIEKISHKRIAELFKSLEEINFEALVKAIEVLKTIVDNLK